MSNLSPMAIAQQGKTFVAKAPGASPTYVRTVGVWIYDQDFYPDLLGVKVVAAFRALVGTAYVRLWDATSSQAVSGSVISTNSNTETVVSSGLLTGLSVDHTYRIQGGRAAGDTAGWRDAYLLVREGDG